MTGIIRATRPAKGWTEIPDLTLRDRRLSYRARGVLARLLSNADGYRMTADDLAREAPDGRHSVLSALRELREAGYLVTVRVQGEKGRFRTETYVFDFPQDTASLKVQKTDVRSPDVGPPDSGWPDVGWTNSIQVYQQENQKDNQQQHQAAASHARARARARAETPTPAREGGAAAASCSTSTPTPPTPGGGGGGKARRRRQSGIVTWHDNDIQKAEKIEQQHDTNDIQQAIESLEKQGLEPVPGRVEKELERLARTREAARRQEQLMTVASQPVIDPLAKAKGEAFLSKIRARKQEKEFHHEASL